MKKNCAFLFFILITGFIQFSCEKDNLNTGNNFYIEFSDGSLITENNIQFYDTSSHLLFLKQKINLNQTVKGFDVIVDAHTIYHGIIFPSYFSSLPSEPIYMFDTDVQDNDILHIECLNNSLDLRNDQRIINALGRSNKLHYGLHCEINNIEVTTFDSYSSVVCTVTVKNNDTFSYYILDPVKMGDLDFNYYSGGLFFNNSNTKVSSFLRWSIANPGYNDLNMNDFSILKAGQEVQYKFSSDDYYKMEKGIYKATFRFPGYRGSELEYVQQNGRIWVGSLYSTMENVIVN